MQTTLKPQKKKKKQKEKKKPNVKKKIKKKNKKKKFKKLKKKKKMSFLKFLKEASSDENLGIFRMETAMSLEKDPIEDVFEADDSDDDEDEDKKEVSPSKRLESRNFSRSLLDLIHKYDPDL